LVWVTFPETVKQAIDLLWEITRRFNIPMQGHRLAALEKVYEWTAAAAENSAPVRVFCPIWRGDDWWMTVNGDTYVSDLLSVCGGDNVFAARQGRYPLEADPASPAEAALPGDGSDTCYPRVTLDEIRAARPEVILLPSEPYAFGQMEADFWTAQTELPAAQNRRIHLVDGSLLTWHGTRLAKALQELPSLLVP
jgi:ABC-type Fe3+-hydroxamate transport system substrate-binding protein